VLSAVRRVEVTASNRSIRWWRSRSSSSSSSRSSSSGSSSYSSTHLWYQESRGSGMVMMLAEVFSPVTLMQHAPVAVDGHGDGD